MGFRFGTYIVQSWFCMYTIAKSYAQSSRLLKLDIILDSYSNDREAHARDGTSYPVSTNRARPKRVKATYVTRVLYWTTHQAGTAYMYMSIYEWEGIRTTEAVQILGSH